MEPNEPHGIRPLNPLQFHTLMDLPATIEKVLIKHGIVLLQSRKMKKYFK